MSVEETENAITELSTEELADLSKWFAGYQARVWDERIEEDLEEGRLDALPRVLRDRGEGTAGSGL